VSDPFNESCQIARPITGGVVPNTPVSITGIQITCGVVTYPIQVDVGGLAAGQSVQLQNFGTDTLTVSGGVNFFPNFPQFPTRLTYGSAYDVTISTQPSSETCAIQGSGMGTVGIYNTVLVTCVTSGTPGTPSVLNNPNGLALSNDHTTLYLANAGGNQVLVYSITRGPAGAATALSLVAEITADIANPTRLAFDPTGEFLYVTNFGPPGSAGPGAAPSNGWVSVYDTANNYAEVVAEKISTGSIMRPLGVAVDRSGNVYVAENGGNAISVYQLQSSGAYQEAAFSPLLGDAAGNQFPAPGALSFFSTSAGDYLFVGTNAGNVFLYAAPLTSTSTPLYTLSHGACSSAPSGPTGFGILVRGFSGGPQSDSSFFVTDFRNGDVLDYTVNNFFGTSACPAPLTQTPGGSNSFPEGLAIDGFGNVFVANSGTNSLFVYANIGLTIAPTLTVH
jgi:sugar lactone lactonase YvrE